MSHAITVQSASENSNTLIPHPPRKPRNIRRPSARDLQIYKMVKIQRAEHWAVAAKFSLHDSRVSQIIKNINRWIASGGCVTDPELQNHIARLRIARETHRLRLLRAVEVATYAVEVDSHPQKTTRRRFVGGTEVWCEETTRPQPEINLSAVRTLLNAAKTLQEFESQDEFDSPPSGTGVLPVSSVGRGSPHPALLQSDPDLLPAVFTLLCTWRTHAEANGRLQPTENIPNLVASILNNLLGSHLTSNSTNDTPISDTPPGRSSALNLSAAPSVPVSVTPNTQQPCVN